MTAQPNPGADPETLIKNATAAYMRQDLEAARQLAGEIAARWPERANGHEILGYVALNRDDAAAARDHLLRADAIAPNQPGITITLGNAFRRLGQNDSARRAFKRAGELGMVDAWRNLAKLESEEGNSGASIAAHLQALALAPQDARTHAALAYAYERRHDLAPARQHAETAIAIDKNNVLARIALARIQLREGDISSIESVLSPVAQAAASPTNRALAWNLIGQARDRQDDPAGAFAAFTHANRIQFDQHAAVLEQSHHVFHPDGVRRMTELVGRTDINAWRAPASRQTPAPVFLIGFPRSGTTLLDQILSSHPHVVCLEERPHLANALAPILLSEAKLAAYGSLSDAEISELRLDYWRRVATQEQPRDGALVVDKLPLHILFLPLIKRIFPDAPIIFALRDPRDVVLSCYQQQFAMNAAMAQFLELERAVAYYDGVMRLMAQCQERLALNIHYVRYEALVADPPEQTRALADFLRIPHDPAMLRFQQTALARDISTPSARQVIEPLHTRSIGRWRRYATELAPVLPHLDAWAESLGYPR